MVEVMPNTWLELEADVKTIVEAFDSSHAWDHIQRVIANAVTIASVESPENLHLIKLGVYFHELIDHKFEHSKEKAESVFSKYTAAFGCSREEIKDLRSIMEKLSFSKNESPENPSVVFQIVQDADRLDAIGAIGIARAFAYGGSKDRPLYERGLLEVSHEVKLDSSHSTLGHFFEKLLHLNQGFHTNTAKNIAQKRHEYICEFVEQFQNEIKGKR
jgi:uncharacterized protein